MSDRLRLPPLHTKMGEQHEVPLTDLMRTVLASQPKTTSKLVFPSERTGGVSGWTKLLPGLKTAAASRSPRTTYGAPARSLMTTIASTSDVAELAIGHPARAYASTTTSRSCGSCAATRSPR